MSISAFFKKKIIFFAFAALLLAGCSEAHENTENITICDFSGFSNEAEDETDRLDALYLYITENSNVATADADEVEQMADNVYAFYEKVVNDALTEYKAKGNDATFEEMLKFLYNLDSKEALQAFAEGYAKNEVKNRMVIRKIADDEGIQISDAEYAELEDTVEVSAYMTGDTEAEVRYELLRRKVLKTILERIG